MHLFRSINEQERAFNLALIFGSQFIGHFIRDWQANEQSEKGKGIGISISERARESERGRKSRSEE